MKNWLIITFALLVTACSAIPTSPKVSFGKKCLVSGDKVSYSYVWIYDKNSGLPANIEDCKLIEKKK